LQVAIDLNIGERQATQYYAEYLKLIGLEDITKIYLEFKGDVSYFVILCKAAKAAKMGVSQVVEVLKIANNYLPGVQHSYELLRKQNNTMESNLRTAAKEFQSLNNMISSMNNTLDGIKLQCGTEAATLEYLQQQRAKLETFVYNFRNDDEGYTKLKKTIEDEVLRILSDKKALLKQAALSITESIRKNPQKYGPLLTAGDSHLPQNLYAETLLEESEKIYSSLTELFVREVVTENVSKQPTVTASPPALRQQNDVPAEDKY
jgi:hypothetical protein